MSEGDDDEGGGRDRGDGGGAWGGSLQGLEVLEHGALPLGGARRADSRLLRVSSSGVGQGFFVGAGTPIPAPWWPLSARTGIPGQADRYRAGGTWSLAAAGSWVEPGSTGPV